MVEKSGGTYDEPPGHAQEERPELKEYPSGPARDEAQPKKALPLKTANSSYQLVENIRQSRTWSEKFITDCEGKLPEKSKKKREKEEERKKTN